VRLYLSSFRMGDHPEHLMGLVGGGRAPQGGHRHGRCAARGAPRGVELELAALADLGVDAAELDLRDYFG